MHVVVVHGPPGDQYCVLKFYSRRIHQLFNYFCQAVDFQMIWLIVYSHTHVADTTQEI